MIVKSIYLILRFYKFGLYHMPNMLFFSFIKLLIYYINQLLFSNFVLLYFWLYLVILQLFFVPTFVVQKVFLIIFKVNFVIIFIFSVFIVLQEFIFSDHWTCLSNDMVLLCFYLVQIDMFSKIIIKIITVFSEQKSLPVTYSI